MIEADLELNRVVPVIEAARKAGVRTPISIDTFRAKVARAAVAAGAHMINDVSGGLLDDAMLSTAAALDVPICLMHYRGDPSTMISLANYPEDTVAAVAAELQQRCNAALRAGVARWNIIVDPGIGSSVFLTSGKVFSASSQHGCPGIGSSVFLTGGKMLLVLHIIVDPGIDVFVIASLSSSLPPSFTHISLSLPPSLPPSLTPSLPPSLPPSLLRSIPPSHPPALPYAIRSGR